MRWIAVAIAVVAAMFGAWRWFGGHGQARHAHRAEPATTAATAVSRPPASFDPAVANKPPVMRRSGAHDPNRPIRPLPLDDAPLRDILPVLKAQAQEGDAVAACRVALELARCEKRVEVRRMVDAFSRSSDLKAKLASVAMGKELSGALEKADAACEGIPDAEMSWAFDYALAAALAGNREARHALLRGWNPVGLDSVRPERTLESWARWRQHVASLITQGLGEGDAEIMAIAANAYRDPFQGFRVFPEDISRSLALQIALANAGPAKSRLDLEGRMEEQVRYGILDAGDIERARAIAPTFTVKMPARQRKSKSPFGDPFGCAVPS